MNQHNTNVQNEFNIRLVSLTTTKSNQTLDESPLHTEVEINTETFRWLRNNTPLLNENAKHDLMELGLIDICLWFCDHYFCNEPLSRSIVLQFLANFSINYEIAGRRIYKNFHYTLRNCILTSDVSKLLNNSMMLLYNLCLYNDDFRLNILKDDELVLQIIKHWTQNEMEYSKIFLDSIFSNSKDFLFVYTNLPNSSKNQVMDILSIWLDNYIDDVSLDVIMAIKDYLFIDCTIEEINKHVVNVLAKASYLEKFTSEIKKHTPLLKKLIELLIVMHERGKNSNDLNDEFSRVKDLSALFVNSDIQTHDRFWFKSDIIRLIANMCYNNQEYQTLIRTNNIIPILLECCSFDAKNPLMREWSLLALRNVLEGNLDNQNFVANIDSVGSIDPESTVMLNDTLKMATFNNSTSANDVMFI